MGRPGVHVGDGGPDPTKVLTLEDLSRELNLLRVRAARGTRSARVSLDDLARRVDEPKSSVHAYVAGIRLAPAQVLDRIVIALGASAEEQREWAEAWYRVSARRHGTRREPGEAAPAEAAPAEAVPHQLPLAVDNFVGRAGQLRELDDLMVHGGSAIAAISGTAGVGKTALAVHWAQTRRARFPDGQLHLDLCGFDPDQPMPPAQALGRLLRALGMPDGRIAGEIDERAAQLRSLLSGRRVLLVLDNARDTEQVRALLPGPPSGTLVTSRDSLTGLVARYGAHRLDLDVLPLPEAAELLRALIGSRHGAAARGMTPQALGSLAEQCARLPLALRIAAEAACSRPDVPLGELVEDLAAGHHELDLFEAGDDPRTALRAVFSWSYRQLPPQAARTFRLIGLHPGVELTREALAALVDASMSDAARTLAMLTQAHLVRQVRPGRYTVHTLLRSYARELALATDPEPEREEALARLRAHVLRAPGSAVVVPRPAHHADYPASREVGSWSGTAAGATSPAH